MRICDLHVGDSPVHGTFDAIICLLLQTDDCWFWDTFETPMILTGKYGVLAKAELAPTRTGAASHSKSLIGRRKKTSSQQYNLHT